MFQTYLDRREKLYQLQVKNMKNYNEWYQEKYDEIVNDTDKAAQLQNAIDEMEGQDCAAIIMSIYNRVLDTNARDADDKIKFFDSVQNDIDDVIADHANLTAESYAEDNFGKDVD